MTDNNDLPAVNNSSFIGISEIAKLSNDMKVNLGLLVENGICKVNGSASLIVMPSIPNYDYSKNQSLLNPLPSSAKQIYALSKKSNGGMENRGSGDGPVLVRGEENNFNDDEFFADNWYFVELHQSILQESTHQQRYSNL
ncbi:hypothetical protein ABK040_005470 [Willaertia magna]